MTPAKAFSLEDYASRCTNYFDRMVDANGLPYFNIFWTDPAEAAHDWPDFGDVMSRQLQGAVMVRRMTGSESVNEKLWLRKVLALINPDDGLLYRPATSFSEPVADWCDASLTLFSLVTVALDSGDEDAKKAALKMVEGLAEKIHSDPPAAWIYGFVVKSLMVCARYLDSLVAADLAGKIVRALIEQGRTFSPDNTFSHGGHMHGNLGTLKGIADYALYVKDAVLFSRVDALYRYVRSTGTSFGFIPEVIGRHDDLVLCETCALMDYIGLAVTLANHGHPEYWIDVERTVRNQLAESQVTDGSWLVSNNSAVDTEQFSSREIGERMVGAWAGWSSPTQFLAAQETLQWGGPELRGKTRAFQNCCGGSGAHALFIAWKNAARFEHGTLSINMHFDKLLPQAEIRCRQPWQGVLTITLKEDCKVRVRIPDFVREGGMTAASDLSGDIAVAAWGNYLELGECHAGELLTITYPLTEWDEVTSIGNPGGRQYRYRVSWKGDTVVRIEPLDEELRMGYSEVEKREVEVYYGENGPQRLYQRDAMRADVEPVHGPLKMDDGGLDFWSSCRPITSGMKPNDVPVDRT